MKPLFSLFYLCFDLTIIFTVCFVSIHHRAIVWKNKWAYTTRDHLYKLVEGKMVPDDFMDVFVVIISESFKKNCINRRSKRELLAH